MDKNGWCFFNLHATRIVVKPAPWPIAPVWSGFPPAAALAPAAAQLRLAASMAPWRGRQGSTPCDGDNHGTSSSSAKTLVKSIWTILCLQSATRMPRYPAWFMLTVKRSSALIWSAKMLTALLATVADNHFTTPMSRNRGTLCHSDSILHDSLPSHSTRPNSDNHIKKWPESRWLP